MLLGNRLVSPEAITDKCGHERHKDDPLFDHKVVLMLIPG